MKIIILNGSPRKNGATAKILHEMEQQLSKRDCTIEFVNICDLKFSPCKGCCACYKTGNCHMKDDAEELSIKISKADGLIIGSPTYASNISGQLKQFIDRGHFVIEQLLYGKYAVSVTTGENYGNRDASKVMVKLLKYSGVKLSGKIICKVPFNSDPQKNKGILKRSHIVAEKLYFDIQKQNSYILQSIVHSAIFNFGIKPFVLGKGEKYNGVLIHWKNREVMKVK